MGKSLPLNSMACAELSERVEAVRERQWLDGFRDVLPRDLEGCLEVESYAGRIRVYESETVPSLLQLGQYAQDRHAVSWKRVSLQQARFEMVKRRAGEGISFDFVIAENVLVRPVGGPRLMADRLRTLHEAGRLANVSVSVVPAGLCGCPEPPV